MIKENQALEVCVTSQWTLLFPDPLHAKPPAGFVSKSGAQLRNSGNIGEFDHLNITLAGIAKLLTLQKDAIIYKVPA